MAGPAGPVNKPSFGLGFRVGSNAPTLPRTLGLGSFSFFAKAQKDCSVFTADHSGKSHVLTLCLVLGKPQENKEKKIAGYISLSYMVLTLSEFVLITHSFSRFRFGKEFNCFWILIVQRSC